VGAESNVREEALGSLLLGKRLIDDQQLQFLLAETKKRGQKMGTVLVELGWMTPEEVLQYLAAQARKRITDSPALARGHLGFTSGDNFSERVMAHDLGHAEIVLAGLYRTARLEDLIGPLRRGGRRPARLLPRFAPFQAVFEVDLRPELLMLIMRARPASARSCCATTASRWRSALEALLTTGLAELDAARSDRRAAARLGAGVHARASRQRGLRRDGTLPPGPDDTFEPTRPEMPTFDPGDAGSPIAALHMADSGRVDLFIDTRSQAGTVVRPETGNRPDLRTQLLREYLELQGKSHYEVLGVTPRRASRSSRAPTRPSAIASLPTRSRTSRSATTRRRSRRCERVRPRLPRAVGPVGAQGVRQRAAVAIGDARARQTSAPSWRSARASRSSMAGGRPRPSSDSARRSRRGLTRRRTTRTSAGRSTWPGGWRWRHGPRAPQPRARARPDLPKAHEFIGRLAHDEGDFSTARRHIERALEREPAQPALVEILIKLYGRVEDGAAPRRCTGG
jgi:hypothetical protein